MIRTDRIPADLRAIPHWVCWSDRDRNGKPTKIPMQPDGSGEAKSNDPATWGEFSQAMATASAKGLAGVGYMFAAEDGLVGIDLDGCRDPASGAIAEWAREIIRFLNCYAEVSPSQTGVKIFCRGKLPFDGGKKVAIKNAPSVCEKSPAIEVYSQKRFFTVTGLRLNGHEAIREVQGRLDELCAEYFPPAALPVAALPLDSSVVERARRYVARMEAAIAGSGGHNATFYVACVLVIGFALPDEDAYPILCEYNERCSPPWSERELLHKLKSAGQQTGPRGVLRDARPDQLATVKLPRYSEPPMPPAPATSVLTMQDAATAYLESLSGDRPQLMRLGVGELDYAIGGGVAFGEVVVIAARPSHGKSAVALQAMHRVSREGYTSLMISEEMSSHALGKRTIQFVSETPEEKWREESTEIMDDLKRHYAKRAPSYIAENCRSAEKAIATMEHFVAEHGVKLVVVDYAQLLQGKGRDRYEQVTQTSIAIRGATTRLGVVTLLLCQLSRQIEGRESFIPRASDLKESGQLEQDADVVAMLVWPHKIDPTEPKERYQIYVAKNRNRAINLPSFSCEFDAARQKVSSAKPKFEFGEYGHAKSSDDE